MPAGKWTSASMPYLTPRRAGATDAWTAEAAAFGARGSNRIVSAGECPAPKFVATAFDLEKDTPVIHRRRIVLQDEQPVEIATSYYPTGIASNTPLEEPQKIKGGAITLLGTLGYRAARVTEEVFAHPAADDESRALDLPRGEAVLSIQRVSYTEDGTPFQAEIMTAPATLRRLRYEMEVGPQ